MFHFFRQNRAREEVDVPLEFRGRRKTNYNCRRSRRPVFGIQTYTHATHTHARIKHLKTDGRLLALTRDRCWLRRRARGGYSVSHRSRLKACQGEPFMLQNSLFKRSCRGQKMSEVRRQVKEWRGDKVNMAGSGGKHERR